VILAHLSDLHLGFRAYGRVERGMDLRERDVAAALERAVRELVRLRPAVVVVAGDVFDRPDPAASAVVALARGLESLRAALPDTPVLMVAGPRDTPRREGDPGALAVLDAFANVEAATTLMRSILIERLDLHVALVPHRAVLRHPVALPEPDPRRRWNVLVMHGLPGASGGDGGGVPVDVREWDYVALGGEHRRRELAERVRYAGSLERVDLDPWDQATDEKGFLTIDLESGRARFHPVRTRAVAALAPVKVESGDAERVRRRVREVTGEVPGGIDGKIARLRLEGARPRDLLALQGPLLEELRARALHLAVEPGREPRTPPTAWSPRETARLLREAVLAELERDGAAVDGLRARVLREIPEPDQGTHPPETVAPLEALDARLPGLGRVSTSVPPGVTAVFGGGGGVRRALAELILDAGATEASGAVGVLWRSIEVGPLEGALERAVAAVAEARGVGLLEQPQGRLVPAPEPLDPARAPAGPDGSGLPDGTAAPADGASLPAGRDREDAARELAGAEAELRDLRAEAAETDGDVVAAMMDWLRERQDAETTLQAYRDRARELRTRLRQVEEAGADAPCPTCGRVLADHHEQVLAELREEWEAVVQDGSWWRSRWAQLEAKPESLRDLERLAVRLHAALESAAERVELLRARVGRKTGGGGPASSTPVGRKARGEGTGSALTDGAEAPSPTHGRPSVRAAPLAGAATGVAAAPGAAAADPAFSRSLPDAAGDPVLVALARVRAARLARARELVLDRASRFLCRLSGGRILAATEEEGRVLLQGVSGPLAPLADEDLALASLALRLAGAALVAETGRPIGSLLVGEAFDRLDGETRERVLRLLRRLSRLIPRQVVVTRGESVDARPELFDFLLEVRDDAGADRPLLRPTPGGPGRISLRGVRPPERPGLRAAPGRR